MEQNGTGSDRGPQGGDYEYDEAHDALEGPQGGTLRHVVSVPRRRWIWIRAGTTGTTNPTISAPPEHINTRRRRGHRPVGDHAESPVKR